MFHDKKWGWKRLAANLLLVPLLGGWAGVAHAQLKKSSSPLTGKPPTAGMPAPKGPAPKSGGDYKAMLKQGRKALDDGQFDRAQDLARAAEANNVTGKWGLFDDTPRSLLEDIQKAVAKSQKNQSEQMLKEAKALLAKPAPTPQERAANLDRALQLAQQAERLHGPYSVWDLGDRPDKVMKDIQTTRTRLKIAPAGGAAVASGGPKLPNTNSSAPKMPPVLPASGTGAQAKAGTPAAPTVDARKTAAVQLMSQGRQLADQGQFIAARAKFTEADRVGAIFEVSERSPGFELQELNTRGSAAIDRLLAEARIQIERKDFAKADAALNGAAEVAANLGLFAGRITETQGQLWAASGGKVGKAGASTVAVGGPEILVPAGPNGPMGPMGPLAPSAPGIATVGGTSTVPMGGPITGRQLLDQAAIEYRNGDLDTAAKLSLQAHNIGGVKDEATDLLRSIDAERLAQKQLNATRSFDAANEALKNKDYNHALGVLVLIDPNLLTPELKTRHAELIADCRSSLEQTGNAVATASGTQLPSALPGENPTGSARTGSDAPVRPDSATGQANALKQVQVQKFRAEGLEVQRDAQAAFGRGETDLAIQMLLDHSNRVRNAGMDPSVMAMLLTPINSRLEMFRVMKGQTDALGRVNRETREAKDIIAGRGLAEEQRQAEVKNLVRKYHDLVKKSEFGEAEKLAMQAKQLDPDNPALSALAHMAKVQKRVREQEQLKADKDLMVYGGLTDAERQGPLVTIDDPVAVRLESMRRAQRRGSLDNVHISTRTPAEFEIEMKLDKPIPIEISQTPLDQAIEHLRNVTNLPISIDTASIAAEGINLSTPITERLSSVATRHVLSIILEKAGLSYVVENDVVKVTTTKKAKGRLFTKVFSVADLVTPIPNFVLPDYSNFDKMLNANAINRGHAYIQGLSPTPHMPQQGLGGGAALSGQHASNPGISGGLNFGASGQLDTNQFGGSGPLDGSANITNERNTKHEQLMKLITGMVRPYSWDGMGGPGRVEYFDIGSALVVNQTADVIQEVADLLEALRRLQDLAIAVEIRIVSLSETWYERLGVDFSMNIKTHNTQFEPALTQIDPNTGGTGVFRPSPYINDNNFKGVTVGLSPAGTFTGDLDVPIRPNTFNRAIPPFGGYPNTPGDNGGVAFGLAFLNDIQVYLFMEAAQGNRRVNVMQAPKLTLFNGQTATLTVSDLQFFVTSVSVVSVNGQLVFIPQNTPLPGPDTNFSIGVQAVVSADRRFVRLNLPVNLAAQSGAVVPLFPITTFVTPVFEGGSQGIPIPFTQFLQQPSFTNLNIQTTVVCPDGGTVLLGGLKTLQEGRNEFGPPVLSKIPYLNRLFKNVGIGRETRHIMIMVTPRIIINSEEEIFQTEGRPPLTQP